MELVSASVTGTHVDVRSLGDLYGSVVGRCERGV
jgi:hypothetical protein